MADLATGIGILDWIRTGAAVIVPFAAVYFATWRGLNNARMFYVESQQQRADRMLRATITEMAANIKKFRPDASIVERALIAGEEQKTESGGHERFYLNKNTREPTKSSYEALVEHFGVIDPEITVHIMQFYEMLELSYIGIKDLQDKALKVGGANTPDLARTIILPFGTACHEWKQVLEKRQFTLTEFEQQAHQLAMRTIERRKEPAIKQLSGNESIESM